MGISFQWDPLEGSINDLDDRMDRALTAIMAFEAPRVEASMKSGASWTDQTGNARGGLFARPFAVPKRKYGIDLGHSVPYGIWLEVRFGGRYAIITPTLTAAGPQVMATASMVFARM